LLSYRDDVDLNKKLAVWERFYKGRWFESSRPDYS